METIYKYPLRCTSYASVQIVEMPEEAELLTVASQPQPGKEVEQLYLWAKVDTDNLPSHRKIIVVGTGQPFAAYQGSLKFISTFCMDPDRATSIGHAFELIPAPGNPGKGRPGGDCNRTCCQQPGAIYWNWSTEAYYCEACAYRINQENRRELCTLRGVMEMAEKYRDNQQKIAEASGDGKAASMAQSLYIAGILPQVRQLVPSDLNMVIAECMKISGENPLHLMPEEQFEIPSLWPGKKYTGNCVIAFMMCCLWVKIGENEENASDFLERFPAMRDALTLLKETGRDA